MADAGPTGAFLFASSILAASLLRQCRFYEAGYWAERKGRLRVELEMKTISNVQLKNIDGFFVQPIAEVQSCYRTCLGTPRQGALVPSARSSINLHRNMSPEALDGLEEFSHVWLTFRFHLNANTLKNARAFEGAEIVEEDENGEVVKKDNNKYTFIAKITPPMLKEKKGVLATRSPHRPNPVGVTLARIIQVDKKNRCIIVGACDLVEGTPILDIKPYVPAYDTVTPFKVPTWIAETIDTRNEVIVSEKARNSTVKIQSRLRQYKNDPELFLKAIVETLEADVRSEFQTKKRMDDSKKGVLVEVAFDEATVLFFWKSERALEIEDVVLTKYLRREEKEMLGLATRNDREGENSSNSNSNNNININNNNNVSERSSNNNCEMSYKSDRNSISSNISSDITSSSSDSNSDSNSMTSSSKLKGSKAGKSGAAPGSTKQLCRSFQNGTCKYGDECIHIHRLKE